MKIPLTLRRTTETHPVAALLVPTTELADVLRLCEQLPTWPDIYPTSEGFLLVWGEPGRVSARSFVGAIHLRELLPRLLVPWDADLVPPLLPDEAAGLVKAHGLIFLPGGTVLAYQPGEPLSPLALLGVERFVQRTWEPLPEPPRLAEQLCEVRLELPEVPPEELLQPGNEEIGSETPSPPASGPAGAAAGHLTFGLGKMLAGLGAFLHWKGLANLGAKMMQGGMSLAPQLNDKVFGQQEAVLRRLLQAFKEGRTDEALRRALPLANDVQSGSASHSTSLPFHNLLYSLGSLLGSSGGSGGGFWLTSHDVFHQLQQEYRKQAEAAERRGDFRRAAFIYGKLLSDYRSAALVLARGGLHHDAAVLYLQKLDDVRAAAQQFEAAGETDRALQLYRQEGDHEQAGDLLKRLGDTEQALAEYTFAAEEMVRKRKGNFVAAELLRIKAERPDLALPYYRRGWELRPQDAAFACASQLTRYYTETAAVADLFTLVEEAEQFFAEPGHETAAAKFFNELVGHANHRTLARHQEDLRDRALVALGSQLCRRMYSPMPPGQLVSLMLPATAAWSPAQRSDAEHAVKAASFRKAEAEADHPPIRSIRIDARTQVVTATSWEAGSAGLYLGFESGEVICYRPNTGLIGRASQFLQGKVIALFADAQGLYSLHLLTEMTVAFGHSVFAAELTRFALQATVGFNRTAWRRFACHDSPLLFPADSWNSYAVAVWTGQEILFFNQDIIPCPEQRTYGCTSLHMNLQLSAGGSEDHVSDVGLKWRLGALKESTLQQPLFHWLHHSLELLVVAGIDATGTIHVSEIERHGKDHQHLRTHSSFVEGYLALCFLRKGIVAGVRQGGVHWFKYGASGLRVLQTTSTNLPNPVACFPLAVSRELLIVCSDGTVARVPYAV